MSKLIIKTTAIVLLHVATITSAGTDVYGLFVGIDYRPWHGSLGLRYDQAAEDLYNAFSDNVANFQGIVAPITGTKVTREQMWHDVGPLYKRMDSDDILVVYMGGHGGQGIYNDSETDGWDECISLSNDGSSYWYDDDMFELLNELGVTWRGASTWILLDSCYSGGFWGDNNPGDLGDLEKLTRWLDDPGFVGLLASAPEDGLGYARVAGYGYLTQVLCDALDRDLWGYSPASGDDKVVTWNELVDYVQSDSAIQRHLNTVCVTSDVGDPLLLTADMWNPVAFGSGGVSHNLMAAPIPAPGAIILASMGACFVGYLRRHAML